MNILVGAPYRSKILKSIEALEKIKLGEVKLIGDKQRICQTLKEEKIIVKSEIVDIKEEEEIFDMIYSLKSDDSIVLVGDISEHYQKKLCNANFDDETNYFYIIDLPNLKHFIFVSNYSRKKHLDFEDKKKAIMAIFRFMAKLGVRKSNVALITDQMAKTDILEVNLIRMVLKDEVSKYVNILSPCSLDDIFSHKYYNNIYDKNINMFIFKNYDITKTFVNTLSLFSENKIASICSIKNNLYINANDIKDEQDILFSVLLMNKYIQTEKYIPEMARIN